MPMSPMTGVEQHVLSLLDKQGVEYAILEPTPTGLRKATLDATQWVREFLKHQKLHDYSLQGQGVEFKRKLTAAFVDDEGNLHRTHATVLRPASGRGDPRIWFPGLKDYCDAREKLALINSVGALIVFNISRGIMFDFGDDSARVDIDSDSRRWELLARVWERSTGGRDVAATPTSDGDRFPTARRPAGVSAGIEWLRSGQVAAGPVRMLFLVGGPGAGKSHAAAEVVRGLAQVRGDGEELAQRAYRYSFGDRELLLVNDATITSDEFANAPLANEITGVVDNAGLLMACVNRGVLVEEAAALRRSAPSIGSEIVRWLHAPDAYAESLLDQDALDGPVVIPGQDVSYLRTASVHVKNSAIAELVVVNVDACSLLEATPRVIGGDETTGLEQLVPETYRIMQSINRTDDHSSKTSGGELFSAVIEALSGSTTGSVPDGYLDPFDANIRSLASKQVQAGVLTILRSAEIVSGATFTFRDLWGALARCVVGGVTGSHNPTGARQLIERLQPKSPDPLKRFEEMQRLAQFRFSQAIFGVGMDVPTKPSDHRSNPVTRKTRGIDPVIDTVPGWFSSQDPSTGWASPIAEAFSGPVTSGSPLDALERVLGEADRFSAVVTDFDRALDQAFVAATSLPRLADTIRQAMVAWYGRYITRLYAVAQGIPAFRREIATWTLAWTMAPELPGPLQLQLKTLVRPPRDGPESSRLIPLLDSRAEPIMGDVIGAKLALASGPFDLRSSREGEELYFRIVEGGHSSPRIRLDFALVRQAQSCTADWIGVTEVADATSPRLERFRSTQLVRRGRTAKDSFVVLAGAEEHKIQAGGWA